MSATMAREKKNRPATPPAEPAPAPDRHRQTVISFRPDSDEFRAVLQRLADEERRSLSQMIQLLLEELLEQKGLWPPKKEGGA